MTLLNNEILLIDDDCNDIELAMFAFTHCNLAHAVHTVNNGVDAIACLDGWDENDRLPGSQPRLVILDLKMPQIDGFEILEAIRNSAHSFLLPVVILTSSRMPSDIQQAYRLGCNA